jgi:glycosyltransferase 2 family protein
VTGQPDARLSSQQKWLRTTLQAILHYGGSALILFLLFRLLPGRRVWHALGLLPTYLWVIALVGNLAAHCIGVCKYRLVVNLAGAELRIQQAARCYFAGLFGSLFLPSLIGGDLLRAALAMRMGKTKAGVLVGSLVDRMIDLVGLALLAGTGALWAQETLDPARRRIFVWFGGAVILGVLLCAIGLRLLPIGRFSFRMRRRLVRFWRAGRSMARRPRVVLGALGLGISVQLIFMVLNIALAEAFGLRLPFRAWLFAWPLAKLSAALPITQGGIGVREAALAALLLPFGASAALGVAAGIAWDTIMISGALVGGLFSLVLGRTSSGPRSEENVR